MQFFTDSQLSLALDSAGRQVGESLCYDPEVFGFTPALPRAFRNDQKQTIPAFHVVGTARSSPQNHLLLLGVWDSLERVPETLIKSRFYHRLTAINFIPLNPGLLDSSLAE